MPAAKPCLGYPSRTEAVVALKRSGLSTRAIAERIGIQMKTVVALEHSSDRWRKPRPSERMGRTVVFPVDVLDALALHAAKRGMHANRLACLIVATVVDDGMVDAVLDDGED